ncbi:MAG: efflux RND transporter permease subunit, partial [Gemmatimonadota bacterium]|nr:efflux RND transporter permease subunit [Gemmatimonadota bacterium]
MKLSDLSISRPVLASMLSLALVLFGVIGYLQLPVREYPDVDPPIISVSTVLPGANPQVVESAVTDIMEEELSTVPGLRTLTSSSAEQTSNITLEFTLDRDVDDAAQDVRDRVSRVRGRLPEDVREPVIAKQEADAQPFYWLALTGENYDLLQLTDIADRYVKTRLQSLPGVGRAFIAGERRMSMRVWLDAPQLAARGLTVQDVENAIRSRNVEVPAGRIESESREFSVRSLGELKTPGEFADLVVSNEEGQLVRLRDLGRVELGPEDDRSALRYNGISSVGLGIVRQSKSNLMEVADVIEAELPGIRASLPPGVDIETAFDGSIFVRRSILEAQETLAIAGALVVLIIFVFLRNLRATIIPGLAIPASIISAFAVMYFLGFSINNLTLLALTLAIGIVVDDAIIVLENAYRHQEELGEDPETAAREGTREIGFAVIATTISLIAVFTPLAFLEGNTGRLFNEFGIAVAGAVAVSGFVALTLTPMLCAKILRVPPRHGRLYRILESGFDALANGYRRSLGWAIAARWVVVGGAVATLLAAVVLFQSLEREFIPPEDRGFFPVFVIAQEGSTLAYTDAYQKRIESILGRTEDIHGFFSIVGFGGGPNRGIIFVRLKDWAERDRPVQDVIGEVQPQFFGIPGVMAFASNPPAFGWGNPVQFVVQHPDFDSLSAAMDRFTMAARQIPGLINVDTDLRVNKPELTVRFDRNRAEDLGVPVRDVAGTLQTMLGGRRISTFTRNNKLYDVMVQLSPEARATPSDMSGLYVRGNQGQLVQLAAVTNVSEGTGPRQLNHFNRVRSFTLTAGLAEGFTLGEAIDSLSALGARVLPPGTLTSLAGESRELDESGTALYFAFGLALIVVFMVLASQFESLIHPFTVMLAVPLAVTGALLTLRIFGSTLNLYSQIGMILLIGLVTKNSILLVEYMNQLKEKGMELHEA